MENNRFNYCPECGGRNIATENNGRKWKCPDCGFTLYNNVASAVGLVIINDRGEVLLEKRAKEPRKGYLAFPGGFVDPDETEKDLGQQKLIGFFRAFLMTKALRKQPLENAVKK